MNMISKIWFQDRFKDKDIIIYIPNNLVNEATQNLKPNH